MGSIPGNGKSISVWNKQRKKIRKTPKSAKEQFIISLKKFDVQYTFKNGVGRSVVRRQVVQCTRF